MSVGARSVGGTTPQSAIQLQQIASQMSHKQQDLFGALPASKRRESSRGQVGGASSDRVGGGGDDVREYRKASNASASPESLIPQVLKSTNDRHCTSLLNLPFESIFRMSLSPDFHSKNHPFGYHSIFFLNHRRRPSLLLDILFRLLL